MDLDHLGDKEFNLSEAAGYGLRRVVAEIAKCEPVCSNCHRERTYGPLAQRSEQEILTL
jgi:hypothetical protein